MDFGPHLILAVLEGVVSAAVLAMTAMGLSLVFGVMRVVNVAHGEFHMLGAVLAWWIASGFGEHPFIGFVAALVIAPLVVGVVAIAADRLILRRIGYEPQRTIIATIGLLYIIQQTTLMTFGPDARSVQTPFRKVFALPWVTWREGEPAVSWPWGFGITSYKIFVIFASASVLGALWLLMKRTTLGLVMRATQQDREVSQAFGVPVDRVFAQVFGLGAALAALGAVLVVPLRQAHYLMGQESLLMSFIVVIIGGLGSLPGTVVAAIVIGLTDGIVSVFFSPTLAKILVTLAVGMVLVFRPKGLMGQ